jgi:hypothetical protein
MTNSLSATIIEILERIFGEDQEAFLANPSGYLEEHGLDNISCEDFNDVFVSFLENAEFENDRGPVQLGADVEVHRGGDHDDDHDSDHEVIAKHLTTIVHEYGDTYIDDRDVYNDQSFNGTLIADDVTFDNDIVNASGDGAVAAGDDIEDSNIVTGDDNIIGNNNQVGDGAFGAGSVAGGVTVDDGGAFANNGSTAAGSQDDNSQDNDQDNDTTTTTTTTNNVDNSVDIDVDVEDSFQANADDSFNPVTETELNSEAGPGDLND